MIKNLLKTKKGILFSLLTAFLVLPLFFYSSHFLQVSKDTEEHIATLNMADKSQFISSQIGTMYLHLLGMQINDSNTNATATTLTITNVTTLGPTSNLAGKLLLLQQVTEDMLANYSNMGIVVLSSDSSFRIDPYGLFMINDSEIRIEFFNASSIKKINVQVRALEDKNISQGYPNNDGSNYPLIQFITKRADKTEVFAVNRTLNPTEYNAPLYQNFNLSGVIENVSLTFGQIDGTSGVLLLQSPSFSTEVQSITFVFDPSKYLTITSGINISLYGSHLSKNALILLYTS